MMKKVLGIVVGLLLTMGVFAGCGGSDGRTQVTLWGDGDAVEIKLFNNLIEEFEAANKDIKIKYQPTPGGRANYMQKVKTALQGGSASDIFYIPDSSFGEWVRKGYIEDMQNYINGSQVVDTDGMWENAVMRYRFDGKNTWSGNIYALPKDIGPTVMYYNKDMFDKAEVSYPDPEKPMSFDKLLEVAAKLSKDLDGDGHNDQYGIGPIWWEGFVWSNGGDILSEDYKSFIMDSDEAAEAIQFAADLTNQYHVCVDSQAREFEDIDLFSTNRVAMIFGQRVYVPALREMGMNFDVCPIPSGKENMISGWSGTVGLGINSKSNVKDEAFRFIEFMFDRNGGQKKQTELGFAVPIYKDMANTDLFLQPDQKPANSKLFLTAAEQQRPTPNTWLSDNQWWDTLNSNMTDIWSGKATAKSVLTQVKAEVERLIKKGNPYLFE